MQVCIAGFPANVQGLETRSTENVELRNEKQMSIRQPGDISASPLSELVVIKIGGSLFDLPDLGGRIGRLMGQLGSVRPVLVAGGGMMVDVLRKWDETFELGDALSHRLSLEAMSLSAQLLAAICSNVANQSEEKRSCAERMGTVRFVVAREASQVGQIHCEGHLPVFDVARVLLAAAPPPLPESWQVTSDSIAAWLAITLGSNRLILAKSVGAPGSIEDGIEHSLIDRHFVHVCAGLTVEWTNLRDENAGLVPTFRRPATDGGLTISPPVR